MLFLNWTENVVDCTDPVGNDWLSNYVASMEHTYLPPKTAKRIQKNFNLNLTCFVSQITGGFSEAGFWDATVLFP